MAVLYDYRVVVKVPGDVRIHERIPVASEQLGKRVLAEKPETSYLERRVRLTKTWRRIS